MQRFVSVPLNANELQLPGRVGGATRAQWWRTKHVERNRTFLKG